jgi:hypothetical protein
MTPWGVLGEWRDNPTHSLASAPDEGEWSASCPSHFTPRERAPGTHRIRGWVGPRAILDTVVKSKIFSPQWESNPWTLLVQPIAQHYNDWANPPETLISLSEFLYRSSISTHRYCEHICNKNFQIKKLTWRTHSFTFISYDELYMCYISVLSI